MVDAGLEAFFDSVTLYYTDEPSYEEQRLVIRHILEAAFKKQKDRE
jgi:hypothetical protein